MRLLNNEKIAELLKEMPGWESSERFITKSYQLADFSMALSFVNAIGEKAENSDHHPDILLHGWNKVTLTLSTHSEGGVTQKDIDLARVIDSLL